MCFTQSQVLIRDPPLTSVAIRVHSNQPKHLVKVNEVEQWMVQRIEVIYLRHLPPIQTLLLNHDKDTATRYL